MHWLRQLFSGKRSPEGQAAERLHGAIRHKARQPHLYSDSRIPDTMDGRAAAIALFHGLVAARLVDLGSSGRALADRLSADIFDSFDAALRETGVGDASIARKIRALGEHFVGIGVAVTNALNESDPRPALQDVIIRNDICAPEGAEAVSRDLLQANTILSEQSEKSFLAGETGWAA